MLTFLSLLAPYKLLIEATAVLAIVAAASFFGYRHGAASVQMKWDKAEAVRKDAEWTRAKANDKQATEAATQYETATAVITERQPDVTAKRKAVLLTRVAPCSPSAPALTLGELRVPADALSVLRDAAGEPGVSPGPTTSGPSHTVQPRTSVSGAASRPVDIVR